MGASRSSPFGGEYPLHLDAPSYHRDVWPLRGDGILLKGGRLLQQFTPSHVLLGVLIIGCLILRGIGVNGTAETILVAASAFFFGRLTPPAATPGPGHKVK